MLQFSDGSVYDFVLWTRGRPRKVPTGAPPVPPRRISSFTSDKVTFSSGQTSYRLSTRGRPKKTTTAPYQPLVPKK